MQSKPSPSVSVIVVNYNGKKYLRSCLDSLQKLKYPKKKLEVIMVDNGSTDSSVDFVKKKYPAVKVILNDENNYCRANNLGVKKSSGKFVALLNNDAKPEPDWLKELVEVLCSDKRFGGACGKILFPDGKLQGAGHWEMPDFYWIDRGFRDDELSGMNRTQEVESISGCAALYRRDCWDEVGGLDEDFVMYYEDVDFCLRARNLGWKFLYVPSAIAHHVYGASLDEEKRLAFLERNRLLFVAKNFPEKLGEALQGSGYYTVVQDPDGERDITQILPEVLRKLFSEHTHEKVESVFQELLAEIRKVYRYERVFLVRRFAEEKERAKQLQKEIKELLLRSEKAEKGSESERFSLNTRIDSLMGDLQGREEELKRVNCALAGLEKEVASRNEEKKTLSSQLESVRRDFERERETRDEEKQSLSAQLETVKRDIEAKSEKLNVLLHNAEEAKKELESQAVSLRDETGLLRKELESKRGELGKANKFREVAEKNIEDKGRELIRTRERLSLLETAKEKHELETLSLRTELNKIQNAEEARSQELWKVQEKLAESERLRGRAETWVEQAESQIKKNKEKQSYLESKITDLGKTLSELNSKEKRIAAELENSTESLLEKERLLEEASGLNRKLEMRKNELEQQNAKLDALVSRPKYLLQQTHTKFQRMCGYTETGTILLIKPYRVSTGEMDDAIKEFQKVYPEAQLSFLANLDENDYVSLLRDSRFKEKFLFCPQKKVLTRRRLLSLCLKLRFSRYDLTVALQTREGYAGDVRARVLARLGGREWCMFPPCQQKKPERFRLSPLRRKAPGRSKRRFRIARSPELLFASFITTEKNVRLGQGNRYVVRICNPSREVKKALLRIDIYAHNNPVHPQGHHAYMTKAVMVPPGNVQQVLLVYDWQEKAQFSLDGLTVEPDEFWKGTIDSRQLYWLQARLCGEANRILDQADIFQQL